MGRNAQVKRVEKQGEKIERGSNLPTPAEKTRTVKRLKKRMLEVATLTQFEEMIYAAHEDSRPGMRRLLEPMLPANLPCCGQALLCKARHESDIKHAALCPEARLVKLVH